MIKRQIDFNRWAEKVESGRTAMEELLVEQLMNDPLLLGIWTNYWRRTKEDYATFADKFEFERHFPDIVRRKADIVHNRRLTPKNTLEKDVEKALCDRVKELGGLCEKFTSPQKRSVPDRILTFPGNIIIFVELKRPGKVATDKQALDHTIRKLYGCDVRVISTLEEADAFAI